MCVCECVYVCEDGDGTCVVYSSVPVVYLLSVHGVQFLPSVPNSQQLAFKFSTNSLNLTSCILSLPPSPPLPHYTFLSPPPLPSPYFREQCVETVDSLPLPSLLPTLLSSTLSPLSPLPSFLSFPPPSLPPPPSPLPSPPLPYL